MSQLKPLSSHRPLPAHLQNMIEVGAWGDLTRALEGGLSPNLIYDQDQSLFGAVSYTLAETGPEGYSHAAWGPLALVENFVARGLDHCLAPHVPAVVNVAASGQWPWVVYLVEKGYPLSSPGSRSVLHALIEGRLARRLRGQEEQWEDMEAGVRFFPFNKDALAEAKELDKVVGFLAAHGADLEAVETEDDELEAISAMTLAVMYNDSAMVHSLLQAGATVPFDPGEDAQSINSLHPLVVAAKDGLDGVLDLLLEHSGLDVMGHHGIDALHVAASCGHINCMEILCAHGVDCNAPTRTGQFVPLHQAALHGRAEAIDWLLARGASWEMGGDFSAATVLRTHHPRLAGVYRLAPDKGNIIPLRPKRPGVAN